MAVPPFRVTVLDVVRVVNEPPAAVVPPIVVPLIVPPVIDTFARASCSIALFNSALVIVFRVVALWSKMKNLSSDAVEAPDMEDKPLVVTLAKFSFARG